MTVTEEFLLLFKNETYQDYKLIGPTNKRYYYKLKHIKCGTEFVINAYRFISGRRCHNKKCINEKKKITAITGKPEKKRRINKKGENKSLFLNLINKEKDFQLIEQVDNLHYKIKHIVCGNIFIMKYNNFLIGQRCPEKTCYSKKRKKTNLKKYGVVNVSQNKKIQEKKEKTTLEHYGVKNPFQANKIKRKIIKTNLDKYGVINPTYSKEIQEKNKKRIWEKTYKKYNNLKDYTALFNLDDYKGVRETYTFRCNKCNEIFNTILTNFPRCLKCYPLIEIGVSNIEREMADWLEEKIPIIRNKRFNRGKSYDEIDIFIESKKVGIELNGIYWHSEISNHKDKNYHINKSNNLEEIGINLLHIFDIEWLNKKEIVKSIILSKLGLLKNKIYARNCTIKEINNNISFSFFNSNHLQGGINSPHNIGLYYKEELVSCLSFSKPRFNKNYNYEITRFASKINYNIVGGFSKLLKYFINKYNSSDIITYADKRFSNGKLYENNGFIKKNKTSPNYFYTKDYTSLETREKYQKHKLKNLLEKYDNNLTEWENMQMNGYDRIWDCGNLVFEYKK